MVSLDGPGSSGKSSVGAGAALELGYRFCDTGVLYRALTWLAVERGVDPEDGPALVLLAAGLGGLFALRRRPAIPGQNPS